MTLFRKTRTLGRRRKWRTMMMRMKTEMMVGWERCWKRLATNMMKRLQ